MKNRLQQWGATLLVFGLASLGLPMVGVQLRIFNLFGQYQKEAAIGAIAIGAVMWLIGAASRGGTASAAATPVAPAAAANPGMPPPVPSPRTCPKCGAAAAAGDRFCMSCGSALPQPATMPPPVPVATPPAVAKPKSHFALGCLAIIVLLLGGIAWFFFGPSKQLTAGGRQPPALPTAVAGTMTEFPVDPEPKNPMQPTSVVSQTFNNPGLTTGSTPSLQAPKETLPPGLSGGNIAQVAQGMTSTTYRDPSSAGAPVNVHVLGGANVNQAGSIAQGIAQSTGGTLQGVRVQSPRGQTYDGYSMQTATVMVYVLVNRPASTIIIMYTPQPDGFVAIRRLASSVGNGQGLAAYPQLINTYGALPASPPPGYVVTTVRTFTGGELRAALTQNEAELGKEATQALQKAFEAFQMFIPEEGTMAVYNNSFRQEKGVLVGRYSNARKAAVCWRVLAWTVGWTMKKTTVSGMDGLTFKDSNTGVIILRKGPFLAMAMVPGNAAETELLDLAGGIQL
ncbi:MAG TPA: zinc ribbon domain-containing protein [Chthoniobacterales bacterium]|nr:zinc ribbon domain-containing protein [Chthoniobacterales bacterium]